MGSRNVSIDREKICPFLLRIFAGSAHQDIRDYSVDRLPPARDEHVVYTWKDSTLRDVIVLLLSSESGSKLMAQRAHRYSIKHVYLEESRGTYNSRDIGFVFAGDFAKAPDELRGPPARTLQSINFVVGDFLDIALLPLGPSGGGNAFDRRVPSGPRGAFGERNRDRRNGRRDGGRESRSPSPERPARGCGDNPSSPTIDQSR